MPLAVLDAWRVTFSRMQIFAFGIIRMLLLLLQLLLLLLLLLLLEGLDLVLK